MFSKSMVLRAHLTLPCTMDNQLCLSLSLPCSSSPSVLCRSASCMPGGRLRTTTLVRSFFCWAATMLARVHAG